MSASITRRNFLAASAVGAGLLGLAGCDGSGSGTTTVPDASSYPIEAEEWGSGTVRHSEEVVGDARSGDGWTRVTNEGGRTLGVMDTGKLIQVDGYAFKDTNGNGALDLWEDWRQSAEDRAAALAGELTMSQAAALMHHSSFYSLDADFDGEVSGGTSDDPTTLGGVLDAGARTGLNFSFTPSDAKSGAAWNNAVQEYVEALDYAIPVNTSCNPQSFGFPTNLGLGAAFDPDLAKRVAQEESKAYRAMGIAILLGPQMDLATEPRWGRISGTYGEDPALTRDITNAYVSGLQSTYDQDGNDLGWGDDSVIAMIKHYPGDGAAESGREAHNDYGKYNVYPGNNLAAHLIGFVDGGLHLDSATGEAASVMPSYSIAFTEDLKYGELVASGFSKWKTDILREQCGYDGVICTDWGPAEERERITPWGMEDQDVPTRMRAVYDAGIDQIGGESFFPISSAKVFEQIAADEGEEVALEKAQTSARRILRSLYRINLMDNPYVDSQVANDLVQNDELQALASEALDKSVVLLKNADGVICERSEKPTVYIPMTFTEASPGFGDMVPPSPASWSLPADEETLSQYFNIVTDTVGEPTGAPDEDGNATYTIDDIVRASADEMASCDFVCVFVSGPNATTCYDSETDTYYPISLQYGEYVADGPHVREVSLAGDPADGASWYTHNSDTSIERENRSYFGRSNVATNLSDLELILETAENVGELPVVACVDCGHPMVFSEFEPSVSAIVMGFDSGNEAFFNVVAGNVEPSGLLPMQMPASMDAVEAQLEDVPRDMECHVDSEGNEYDFAFGLNWSGVIDDERTQKYKVEPLTTSEYVTI